MSDDLDPRLSALGVTVARALDTAAPRDRLAAQRERLLLAAPRSGGRRTVRLALASAAAAALLALGIALRPADPPRDRGLVATVDGRRLAEGQWLARDGATDTIRFSDQSAVVLGRGAQVRLGAITPDGADLFLERGALDVSVTHRAHSRWRFRAGPWTVAVTGTAFRLAWSPTTGGLELAMREGRVVLSGPRAEGGRAVVRGEHVLADASRGIVAVAAPPATSEVEVAARVVSDAGATLATTRVTPMVPRPPRRAAARPPDAGPAPEAARAHAPPPARDDLGATLAEADRARFEGRVTDARALLIAVRAHHPGTPEAARAAHTLGVLALESLRAPAVAARWFEISLREAPDGPLSRESLGRRVQALREAGDTEAAREAASSYLARDPDGAFAPFARSVLAP